MRADELLILAGESVSLLMGKGKTLSVAESCTGGLIGKTVTDIGGSSSVFFGGFLLYSNEAKIGLAGVNPATLEAFGAVSEETVREMARGTRERCGTDYTLAVSGVAGPGGGTDAKPVGTVWIALDGEGGTKTGKFLFSGDRNQVRLKTVKEALTLLNKII